jgi:hypothetical protein
MTRLGLNPNSAAVHLDDALRDGEPVAHGPLPATASLDGGCAQRFEKRPSVKTKGWST